MQSNWHQKKNIKCVHKEIWSGLFKGLREGCFETPFLEIQTLRGGTLKVDSLIHQIHIVKPSKKEIHAKLNQADLMVVEERKNPSTMLEMILNGNKYNVGDTITCKLYILQNPSSNFLNNLLRQQKALKIKGCKITQEWVDDQEWEHMIIDDSEYKRILVSVIEIIPSKPGKFTIPSLKYTLSKTLLNPPFDKFEPKVYDFQLKTEEKEFIVE